MKAGGDTRVGKCSCLFNPFSNTDCTVSAERKAGESAAAYEVRFAQEAGKQAAEQLKCVIAGSFISQAAMQQLHADLERFQQERMMSGRKLPGEQ